MYVNQCGTRVKWYFCLQHVCITRVATKPLDVIAFLSHLLFYATRVFHCVVYFPLAFSAKPRDTSVQRYIISATSPNRGQFLLSNHNDSMENGEIVIVLSWTFFLFHNEIEHGIVIFTTPMNSMHSITEFLSLQKQAKKEIHSWNPLDFERDWCADACRRRRRRKRGKKHKQNKKLNEQRKKITKT